MQFSLLSHEMKIKLKKKVVSIMTANHLNIGADQYQNPTCMKYTSVNNQCSK